jgi:hypothetical protein
MARMTKTQQRRLIKDVESKCKRLYLRAPIGMTDNIVSTKDMETIEKLCKKWSKKLN